MSINQSNYNSKLKESQNKNRRKSNEKLNKNKNDTLNTKATESDQTHTQNQSTINQIYSRPVCFSILWLCVLTVNSEHGFIAAAQDQISDELRVSKTVIGFLGSSVYIGQIIGTLVTYLCLVQIHPNVILVVTNITHGVLLIVFSVTKIVWLLIVFRIIMGLMQVMAPVYLFIWIDKYKPHKEDMLYLTLYQFAAVSGTVFGFLITNLCKPYYLFSQIVFGIIQIILAILCGWIPPHFTCTFQDRNADLTSYYFTRYRNEEEEVNVSEHNISKDELNNSILEKQATEVFIDKMHLDKQYVSQKNIEVNLDRYISKNSHTHNLNNYNSQDSLLGGDEKMNEGGEDKMGIVNADNEMREDIQKVDAMKKIRKDMNLIMMIPQQYLSLTLVSFYLFVISAFLYWMTEFYKDEFGLNDMEVVVVSFCELIVLPVCTSFITGAINEYLGGQNGPYTKTLSTIQLVIAFVGLMSMPWIKSFSGQNFALCCVIVTAQAGVIPMQGLMINVLPPDLKQFGNLFANFVFGCVGFLPSPFLWGVILDQTKSQTISMFSINIFSVFCLATMLMIWANEMREDEKLKERINLDRKYNHESQGTFNLNNETYKQD